MPLDDLVSVSILTQTQSVSRAGFGVPMLLAQHSFWPETVKTFGNKLTDLTDAGVTVNHPIYRMAQAILSQNPKPTQIKVGKRALLATSSYDITPVDTTEGVVNTITATVGGASEAFSHTNGGSETPTSIATALHTLVNAGSLPITSTDNTGSLTIDGDNAGDVVLIETTRSLDQVNDTPDPGIVTDYTAVKLADPAFYGVLLDSESKAEIAAMAAAVETEARLLVAATADDEVRKDTAGNIGETLNAASYARSALLYHHDPKSYAAAAWVGNRFPSDPGSSTWKYKTLAGVPVSADIDANDESALKGNNVNFYVEVAGVGITCDGWSASGEFIDITRFVDWLTARIQERFFSLLVNNPKLPFTDASGDLVRAQLLAQLQEGINRGGLAADPAPLVTVPAVASVSTADRAARILPDITFQATLAGAIHNLVIDGVLSV